MITIGTYFTIPYPKAIKMCMVEDMFLVVTENSVIALRHPTLDPQISIETTVTKNSTKAFCIRRIKLTVVSLKPNETNCSGFLCDHQRAIETTTNSKSCRWYSVESRRYNIVTTHDIEFTYINDDDDFLQKPLQAWSSTLSFNISHFPSLPNFFISKKWAQWYIIWLYH